MALNYGFFNSINGDRRYDARWFAKYFGTFIGNGVFPNPSTGLQVVESENMTIKVKPGKGWINGYYADNDDDFYLTLDNADGLLKRIDRIILRWNQLDRTIELIVKKGAFASIPVAPELQRDGDYYELVLAEIAINKGVTYITQANITDTRLNTELCGIVHGLVEQVDTTVLFEQYQSWFANQMASYEDDLANWTTAQKQEFMDWMASQESNMDDWTDAQKQAYEAWKNQQQSDMSVWTSNQQQAYLDWIASQQLDLETWTEAQQQSFTDWSGVQKGNFEDWFDALQIILDGDVATNLASRILTIEANDTGFRLDAVDDRVFVQFPKLFFYVDDDGNTFYRPNGDGNAGASFGDRLYIWRVM